MTVEGKHRWFSISQKAERKANRRKRKTARTAGDRRIWSGLIRDRMKKSKRDRSKAGRLEQRDMISKRCREKNLRRGVRVGLLKDDTSVFDVSASK